MFKSVMTTGRTYPFSVCVDTETKKTLDNWIVRICYNKAFVRSLVRSHGHFVLTLLLLYLSPYEKGS